MTDWLPKALPLPLQSTPPPTLLGLGVLRRNVKSNNTNITVHSWFGGEQDVLTHKHTQEPLQNILLLLGQWWRNRRSLLPPLPVHPSSSSLTRAAYQYNRTFHRHYLRYSELKASRRCRACRTVSSRWASFWSTVLWKYNVKKYATRSFSRSIGFGSQPSSTPPRTDLKK